MTTTMVRIQLQKQGATTTAQHKATGQTTIKTAMAGSTGTQQVKLLSHTQKE